MTAEPDGWTGDVPADDSEPPCDSKPHDGDTGTGEDQTARGSGAGTDSSDAGTGDGDTGTYNGDAGTGDGEWPQDGPEDDGQDGPSSSGDDGPRGPRGPARPGRPGGDSGARLAGQVTILIPFETWMGWPTSQLAEIPGWGPADQDAGTSLDPPGTAGGRRQAAPTLRAWKPRT